MKSHHKLKEQLLGRSFQKFYHITCRLILLTTFLVQFAILDFYLIYYRKDLFSLIWIAADLVVFLLFLAAVVWSYRHLSARRHCTKHGAGELPISYFTWLLYSSVLVAKFCFLFVLPDSIASQLREKYFFGPNMLKTGLSLSSIVIYVFVLTNHDTRALSPQSSLIQAIVGSAYVDILDTVQFTDVLLKESSVITMYHLDKISLAIIALNFVLPAEALFVLSKTHYGKFPLSLRNQLLHKVVYFSVVNLPMFVVRLILWHLHKESISVFLIKNVVAIGFAVKDIHEFSVDVTEVIVDGHDGVDPQQSEDEEEGGNFKKKGIEADDHHGCPKADMKIELEMMTPDERKILRDNLAT